MHHYPCRLPLYWFDMNTSALAFGTYYYMACLLISLHMYHRHLRLCFSLLHTYLYAEACQL